jgi:hypothetical protein
LNSPAVDAPPILAARADEASTGFAKAARVLIAARNAIELRIGGTELQELQRLANLPKNKAETKKVSGNN